MITNLVRLIIISTYIFTVQTQTNIPIGWFVDDTTSNDIDGKTFSLALAAAMNLSDYFIWPRDLLAFQSVHDNVSNANIYSGFHRICNQLESGAIGSVSSIDNQKTHLLESFMTRLRISMISLNYFNYNKQESNTISKIYHLAMKVDLLPALAAFIKRYKVTTLYYVVEGEEAFSRFQAMMVAQAREKSYDILDIQIRRLIDIHNQNHTKNLLQSVEINDRGSKEERFIVLDLKYIDSYINLLMQVILCSPVLT
ncbi:unnamed protein product [Rotaria magnacalcarata]|uniref:Uncharacterized protein n=1 Tax=Rotaria magnacalcarata TaxID=392030 RepID=A0A8S2RHR0_9BILA|nr:unnamed protein product [Rotaria magnacalcarata]